MLMPAQPVDFSLHLSKAYLEKYGSYSRLTGFVKKWKLPEKLEFVQIIQCKPVSVVHIVQSVQFPTFQTISIFLQIRLDGSNYHIFP